MSLKITTNQTTLELITHRD